VRGVVKKIDGVRDVNVSLKEGLATIQFGPDNSVKVEQIWKGVRDNGFTPRESVINALGSVSLRGDSTLITVGGSGETFLAIDASGSAGRVSELRRLGTGAHVSFAGDLGMAPPKATASPLVVRLRSFTRR
jgi:copper chaperone CopZ